MKKRYHAMLPYCDILFGSVRDLTELVQWEETDDVENEHDPISYIQSFINTTISSGLLGQGEKV